jgi:threonine dehydrogenase-like Zn-dependent dehydrogenase
VQVGDRVLLDARINGPHCLNQEISPPCLHCRAGNHALCENQSRGIGPVGIGGGWGDGYTAHESDVRRVPDDLDDDQAVLVEPASVALRAVLRRRPEPGERVLVLGCGTIGLLAVCITRIVTPEAHITALARYAHQADMARRLGADEVISGGDAYEDVARLTGGHLYAAALGNRTLLGGFDVIYDVVGTGRTITDSLRWARAGGSVVLVGITPKPVRSDLSPVWHQEVTLLGSVLHGMESWDGGRVHGYDLAMRWIRDGRLPTAGLISHRFPLERYKEAVAAATDRRTGAIKVVFQME